VNKLLRTWWAIFRARRRGKLGMTDVGRLTLRARLTDVDILRHINNGVYLSLADLGRWDLLVRSGIWDQFNKQGWYPVVVNATIAYRKSINLFQRYTIETKLVAFDDVAVYCEQRFVVDGEIYARLYTRARFLKKLGGTVKMSEVLDALGFDAAGLDIPDWVKRWAVDAALPSGREPALSNWS
jgi:acyl-CoA thioesterase FadM